MHNIEVGIPILDNVLDAIETIERACALPGVTAIHVSVNSPKGQAHEFSELASLDRRVRVSVQENNLGLYGNFRYLARCAKAPYFCWMAADDILSSELVDKFQKQVNPNMLTVGDFINQECIRDTRIHWRPDKVTLGRLPKQLPIGMREVFSPEPSWIFGIWQTDYLSENFPVHNFDYLDTFLLTSALYAGAISVVSLESPSIIGIWPNRQPNFVNGRYHTFFRWSIKALNLLVRKSPFQTKSWVSFGFALMGRIKYSMMTRINYYRAYLTRN